MAPKQTFPGAEKSPTFQWLSRFDNRAANFQQEQDPSRGRTERAAGRYEKRVNPLRLLTLCSAIMKEKGT